MVIVGATAGAAMLVQGNTRAEAEPQPDPAEVQRFLAQLEAQQPREAKREKGHEKRLLRVVEDAATRTPSESMINRIENSVVGRLS